MTRTSILLSVLLGAFVAWKVAAEDAPAPEEGDAKPAAAARKDGPKEPSPEERAARMVEMMSKKLELQPAQADKIKAHLLEREKRMDELKKKLRETELQFSEKIRSELDLEQRERFDSMRMRMHMGRPMGGPGMGPGGRHGMGPRGPRGGMGPRSEGPPEGEGPEGEPGPGDEPPPDEAPEGEGD